MVLTMTTLFILAIVVLWLLLMWLLPRSAANPFTVQCRHCRTRISDLAIVCPSCQRATDRACTRCLAAPRLRYSKTCRACQP
jgi:hypothetical protein